LAFAQRDSLLAFHSSPNAATSLPNQAANARHDLTLQRNGPLGLSRQFALLPALF
jgi:hypothetical protein